MSTEMGIQLEQGSESRSWAGPELSHILIQVGLLVTFDSGYEHTTELADFMKSEYFSILFVII